MCVGLWGHPGLQIQLVENPRTRSCSTPSIGFGAVLQQIQLLVLMSWFLVETFVMCVFFCFLCSCSCWFDPMFKFLTFLFFDVCNMFWKAWFILLTFLSVTCSDCAQFWVSRFDLNFLVGVLSLSCGFGWAVFNSFFELTWLVGLWQGCRFDCLAFSRLLFSDFYYLLDFQLVHLFWLVIDFFTLKMY